MTLSYTVDEVDFDHPECIGFVENVAEYEYYNDNGYEKDYENPAHITVPVSYTHLTLPTT